MKIIVTGATGYIGSHLCKILHHAGHNVYACDRVLYEHNDIEQYVDHINDTNITNNTDVSGVIDDICRLDFDEADAIVHLAGAISVEESTRLPAYYYMTNTLGTYNVCQMAMTLECRSGITPHLIFASTAAAFDPISPYAKSKIAAEEIIRQFFPKNHTIFRFFNVAGSDGENRQVGPSTHLIRIAAETAAGIRPHMTLNGYDFDTPDGTCVRDYIHVVDLANAILNAINAGPQNTPYECLGNGKGYSNLEVISAMKAATGIDFTVLHGDRRAGDPSKLIVEQVSRLLTPKYSLQDMCRSAYDVTVKYKE